MIALLLAAQLIIPAAKPVGDVVIVSPARLPEFTGLPRTTGEMPVLGLGSDCKDPQVRVVDPKWRPKAFEAPKPSATVRRLGSEPPAAYELAVDRKLNGCRVRTVVSWPQE